jgi:probable DNA metabolism protein
MKHIFITKKPGFEEWRNSARQCLVQGIPPDDILWLCEESPSPGLFDDAALSPTNKVTRTSVTKQFLDIASVVSCHKANDRFALLYRVLWRLTHENKNLLHYKTDNDVMKLQSYIRAVRKDAYKIKAFLRFRKSEIDNIDHYIAWYEPEHYSLELSLPFFQTRFKNMHWTILTPYLAAHWNMESLLLEDNKNPKNIPREDKVEQYWLKYYATTFNPARIKKSAMLNQMPKKYWKNLPEADLIPDMLKNADDSVRKMINDSQS